MVVIRLKPNCCFYHEKLLFVLKVCFSLKVTRGLLTVFDVNYIVSVLPNLAFTLTNLTKPFNFLLNTN